MTGPAAKDGGRNWKSLGIEIGSIAVLLVLLSTLHTIVVLPATIEKMRSIARDEVEDRIGSFRDRLNQLATKEGLNAVKAQLQSIDERLRHLERNKK